MMENSSEDETIFGESMSLALVYISLEKEN